MVEVGFGMGHALAHFASEHRDWDCVGIEVYRPGIGSLILHCETLGLDNVRIVEGDAATALARWPSGSVRLLAVYFPDPWPKRRHGKRRLIQPPFLNEVARLLEPGGRLLMATDWEALCQVDAQRLRTRNRRSPTRRDRATFPNVLPSARRRTSRPVAAHPAEWSGT